MFERKTKKVTFQDGEITVGCLPVYRTLCMRETYRGIKEDNTDERVNVMADVIVESLLDPKMTIEEVKNLDMDTFNDLLDVVVDNNGMGTPEKNPKPSKS